MGIGLDELALQILQGGTKAGFNLDGLVKPEAAAGGLGQVDQRAKHGIHAGSGIYNPAQAGIGIGVEPALVAKGNQLGIGVNGTDGRLEVVGDRICEIGEIFVSAGKMLGMARQFQLLPPALGHVADRGYHTPAEVIWEDIDSGMDRDFGAVRKNVNVLAGPGTCFGEAAQRFGLIIGVKPAPVHVVAEGFPARLIGREVVHPFPGRIAIGDQAGGVDGDHSIGSSGKNFGMEGEPKVLAMEFLFEGFAFSDVEGDANYPKGIAFRIHDTERAVTNVDPMAVIMADAVLGFIGVATRGEQVQVLVLQPLTVVRMDKIEPPAAGTAHILRCDAGQRVQIAEVVDRIDFKVPVVNDAFERKRARRKRSSLRWSDSSMRRWSWKSVRVPTHCLMLPSESQTGRARDRFQRYSPEAERTLYSA